MCTSAWGGEELYQMAYYYQGINYIIKGTINENDTINKASVNVFR